jgi:hypothetical protein
VILYPLVEGFSVCVADAPVALETGDYLARGEPFTSIVGIQVSIANCEYPCQCFTNKR